MTNATNTLSDTVQAALGVKTPEPPLQRPHPLLERTQALLDKLRACKATSAFAYFNGHDDEGTVHTVEVDGDVYHPLVGEITEWAYDVLEYRESGWEIDHGSYGYFEIHVETGKIVCQVSERHVEVTTYDRSWSESDLNAF